eukprot:15365215-Ditylum_brightwellii.AAC.2
MLESMVATPIQTICPQTAAFCQKQKHDSSCPMFQASVSTVSTKNLMQLASLPAFLVYDGLEHDLKVIMVLNHIQASAEADQPYMQHYCNILKAAMVKYYKNNHVIAPLVECFVNMPHLGARAWAAH